MSLEDKYFEKFKKVIIEYIKNNIDICIDIKKECWFNRYDEAITENHLEIKIKLDNETIAEDYVCLNDIIEED